MTPMWQEQFLIWRNDDSDESKQIQRVRGSLEGIVSKRFDSRYRSGRSSDWLEFNNPEARSAAGGERRLGA